MAPHWDAIKSDFPTQLCPVCLWPLPGLTVFKLSAWCSALLARGAGLEPQQLQTKVTYPQEAAGAPGLLSALANILLENSTPNEETHLPHWDVRRGDFLGTRVPLALQSVLRIRCRRDCRRTRGKMHSPRLGPPVTDQHVGAGHCLASTSEGQGPRCLVRRPCGPGGPHA